MNDDHHRSQFDFYLEERILESSDSDQRKHIMNTFFDFLRSLFLVPAPATARGNDVDLRTLYRMTRGRDSVSPAVLRKLAEAARK